MLLAMGNSFGAFLFAVVGMFLTVMMSPLRSVSPSASGVPLVFPATKDAWTFVRGKSTREMLNTLEPRKVKEVTSTISPEMMNFFVLVIFFSYFCNKSTKNVDFFLTVYVFEGGFFKKDASVKQYKAL